MANSEELLITLGVQDKGANKQIVALNKELKNLDKEYNSVSKTSKDFDTSLQGLNTKLSTLSQKYSVNEAKLEAYKKKMSETTEAISKQQDKINNMKLEGKDTAKAEEQLQRMKNTLRDTEQNIRVTENAMKSLNNEISATNNALQNHALEEYKQQIQKLGDDMQTVGTKITNFGNGMSSVGNSLMILSAPMIAFGAYATKAAIDFEQAMANLQATSGATGSDFESLENKAKELGENTCKSATDSANAMQFLALAGYDVNQILSSTEPVLKASVAWGADMAISADLATDSMSSLGMETSRLTEYLDVCSQAQRSSNTTATQMMEAYIGCGGTLKTLGVPLQESATWLGILANQGKKGSEAGNNLNSMLVNLIGASSSANSAMEKLNVSAWDSDGNFIGMTETLNRLNKALSNCTQEQRTNFQAAIGGKTQLDTLNMLLAGCGDQYENLRVKINNASGATEEMYTIMNDTAQGKIEAFKSKCEALGIQIGDKLLPHINDLLDKAMELIDWFGNLDEGTQSAILQFGLLTFATGGLLSTTGKVVSNIGGLVTWIGKITATSGAAATTVGSFGGALGTLSSIAGPVGIAIAGVSSAVYLYKKEQEALNNTVITSKEEMGFLESALLSLNGVQVKSRQELEESGSVYKKFSDKVSENMRKAITKATTSIHEFNIALNEINLDGVLDDNETEEFNNKISECMESALSTIKENKSQIESTMNDLFGSDGKIDDNEQAIIDLCTREFEVEAEEVRKNQDEINKIYNTARSEGRSLKPEEEQAIKDYYARIKEIELECQASDMSELEASKIDFNNRLNTLDSKGASDLLVQKKQELDEERILKANQYDQIILNAKKSLDTLNDTDRAAAEERIQYLEKEKQQCIEKFEDQWSEYKSIVSKEAPTIAEDINAYTGEMLSDMDIKNQNTLDKYKETYSTLSEITEEGWYRVRNVSTGSMDDIYVSIDKNTGDIVGCYNSTTDTVCGYSEEMANSAKENGKAHEEMSVTAIAGMENLAGSMVNTSGQVIDSMGNVVSELYNFEETADGTYTAIANINGIPIQIETNADGVILGMHQVGDSMDGVTVKADGTSEEVKNKFMSAANKMPEVGSNIVSGIGTGIDGNKESLFSKIGTLCSNLLKRAKTALDIHSPSRVFRDIIGKNITLGISEGINYESGTLYKTIENVLSNAKKISYSDIDSFEDVGSKFIDSFKVGINTKKEKLQTELQNLVDMTVERLKNTNNYDANYYVSIGKGYTNDISEEVERAFKIIANDEEAINEKWRENNKKTIDEIKKEAQKTIDKWNEDSAKNMNTYYTKLYKEDLQSSSKALMDSYEKFIEDGISDATTKINNAINKISKESEEKYNNLIDRQKSMRNKLTNLSDMFEYDDEKGMTLTDFEPDIWKMNEYQRLLEKMKNSGVSDNFLSEIEEMDINKANIFMTKMLNMNNDDFWGYIDSWEQKNKLAKKISRNYYKDQIDGIETEFTDKLNKALSNIPQDMVEIGNQAIQGFISGMDSKTKMLLDTSTDIANSVSNSFRAAFDIHSPSRVFKTIGEFVSEGLGIGITDKMKDVNVDVLNTINSTVDISKSSLLDGFESIASKLNNVLLSGSYYIPDSFQSRDLISTTNSIVNNYNSDSNQLDYNKLSSILISAISSLNINLNIDKDGMVEKSVDATMKKLNKMYKE